MEGSTSATSKSAGWGDKLAGDMTSGIGFEYCGPLAVPPSWCPQQQDGRGVYHWCGVVCRRRCYQKAKAGMSTHGYR